MSKPEFGALDVLAWVLIVFLAIKLTLNQASPGTEPPVAVGRESDVADCHSGCSGKIYTFHATKDGKPYMGSRRCRCPCHERR